MRINIKIKNYLRCSLSGLLFVFCFLSFLTAEPPELHQLLEKSGVQELRHNLQTDLDVLVEKYAQKYKSYENLPAAELSVKKADLQRSYGQERDGLLLRYRQYDKRSEEINIIKKELDGKIVNTGSYPKNPLADVDLAALSDADAHKLAAAWKKIYGDDKVIFNDYKYVNTETDTTLWLPNTDERMSAKLGDADAFFTSGGLKKTGVRDALTNELGWFLDNEQKLLHAIDPEGGNHDLKTVGKSLNKVMESNSGYKGAGIDDGSPSYAVKVREQAKVLQNYGDVYKAGIVDFGDSPEVVDQKTKAWLQKALSVMDSEANKSAHRAHRQQAAQIGLVHSLADTKSAWVLKERVEVSDYQNLLQSRRNMEMREKLPFQGRDPVYFDGRYAAHFASEVGELPKSFEHTETKAILRVEKLPDSLRSREYGTARITGLMSSAIDIYDPVSFLGSKLSASPHPSSRIAKMGSALVLLGLYANYNRLKAEAENAENLDNPDVTMRENSEALKNARIFGAAILETTGAPEFMRNLGDAVSKEFDQADVDEEFIAKLTMVGARVFAASADATIFQPITEIIEAFIGFKDLGQTVWTNFVDGFRIREEEELRKEASVAKRAQAAAFGLSEISMALGDFGGPPVVRPLSDQDIITFEAKPNQNWTTAYLAEWMLLNSFGAKVAELSVTRPTSDPLAHRHGIKIQEFPTAKYAVMLRISNIETGNSVDWRRVEFSVSDPPRIGRITMYQAGSGRETGGMGLRNPVDRGVRIIFYANRLGLWPESGIKAEWFVDGELYKVKDCLEPGSNLLTLNTENLSAGIYQVSFRLVERESGKIISHQRQTLIVGKKEDGQGDEKSPDDEEDDFNKSAVAQTAIQNTAPLIVESVIEEDLSNKEIDIGAYQTSVRNYEASEAVIPTEDSMESEEELEVEIKYGIIEKKAHHLPLGGLSPVDRRYQAYYRQIKGQPGRFVPFSSTPKLYDAKGRDENEVYHGFAEVDYNGFPVQRGQYVNGIRDGEWLWFHPESRKLVRIANYKNGRRIRLFEFNSEGYLLCGEDRELDFYFKTRFDCGNETRKLFSKSPHMESSDIIKYWRWYDDLFSDRLSADLVFSRKSSIDECIGFDPEITSKDDACSKYKPGIFSSFGLRESLSIYDPQRNTDVYSETMRNVDGKTVRVDYYDKNARRLILEPEDFYIEMSQPMVTMSNYKELFATMHSYLSKEKGSVGAKNPRQIVENYNKRRAEKNKNEDADGKDADKKEADEQDVTKNDPVKKELYKKLQPYFAQYKVLFDNVVHYRGLFLKELMSILQIGSDLSEQKNQVCDRYKKIRAHFSNSISVKTGSPEYDMMMEVPGLQKKCAELSQKEQIWDEAFKQFEAISEIGQRVYALKNHQALNQNFSIKTDNLASLAIKLQDALKVFNDSEAALKAMGGRVELLEGKPQLLLK